MGSLAEWKGVEAGTDRIIGALRAYHRREILTEEEEFFCEFECPHPLARGRLNWNSAERKFFKESLEIRLRRFTERFDAGTAFDPKHSS